MSRPSGLFRSRDAALVAIGTLEIGILKAAIEIHSARGGHSPAGVTTVSALDLDYIGAEIGEHHGGDGTLLPDCPVENSNPFERHGHFGRFRHRGLQF